MKWTFLGILLPLVSATAIEDNRLPDEVEPQVRYLPNGIEIPQVPARLRGRGQSRRFMESRSIEDFNDTMIMSPDPFGLDPNIGTPPGPRPMYNDRRLQHSRAPPKPLQQVRREQAFELFHQTSNAYGILDGPIPYFPHGMNREFRPRLPEFGKEGAMNPWFGLPVPTAVGPAAMRKLATLLPPSPHDSARAPPPRDMLRSGKENPAYEIDVAHDTWQGAQQNRILPPPQPGPRSALRGGGPLAPPSWERGLPAGQRDQGQPPMGGDGPLGPLWNRAHPPGIRGSLAGPSGLRGPDESRSPHGRPLWKYGAAPPEDEKDHGYDGPPQHRAAGRQSPPGGQRRPPAGWRGPPGGQGGPPASWHGPPGSQRGPPAGWHGTPAGWHGPRGGQRGPPVGWHGPREGQRDPPRSPLAGLDMHVAELDMHAAPLLRSGPETTKREASSDELFPKDRIPRFSLLAYDPRLSEPRTPRVFVTGAFFRGVSSSRPRPPPALLPDDADQWQLEPQPLADEVSASLGDDTLLPVIPTAPPDTVDNVLA